MVVDVLVLVDVLVDVLVIVDVVVDVPVDVMLVRVPGQVPVGRFTHAFSSLPHPQP